MSIIFTIGNNKVHVLYDVAIQSEYIKATLEYLGFDNEILIPDKYNSTIGNYVDFLNGKEAIIDNVDDLKQYLNVYTFFVDQQYFYYLLQQLFSAAHLSVGTNLWFDHWSYMFTMVYTDVITTELQWEILVHCPHDFIPQAYIDNKKFFKEWQQLNKNKIIKVNDNQQYHVNREITNDDGLLAVHNYHTEDGNRKGYYMVNIYYNNGHIKSISHYVNEKAQGLWKVWYPSDNGQNKIPRQKGRYVNGKPQGLWEMWYPNGQPRAKGKYVSGQKEGMWKGWHENQRLVPTERWAEPDDSSQNGNISYVGEYVDDKEEGLWQGWYENGNMLYRGNYINNNKEGLWEKWTDTGIPLPSVIWVNGKQV